MMKKLYTIQYANVNAFYFWYNYAESDVAKPKIHRFTPLLITNRRYLS
jgi:hypothetical protein